MICMIEVKEYGFEGFTAISRVSRLHAIGCIVTKAGGGLSLNFTTGGMIINNLTLSKLFTGFIFVKTLPKAITAEKIESAHSVA